MIKLYLIVAGVCVQEFEFEGDNKLVQALVQVRKYQKHMNAQGGRALKLVHRFTRNQRKYTGRTKDGEFVTVVLDGILSRQTR